MQAVILAGGNLSGSLKVAFPQATNKAHLEVNGKMLIEYVLAAVLSCPYIEKVFIVGDKDFLSVRIQNERTYILQDTGSIYDNFMLAAACGQAKQMLLLTGDIPLLDNVALNEFISGCKPGLDICYSIVSKAAILQYDAQGRRTYARTAQGVFTGGNIFMVDVAAVRRARPAVENIFAKRKNVFALLNLVGLGFVLKYLLSAIDLRDLEQCAGRILQSKVQAVVCEHAAIGIDVDKIQDLELVTRHL